MEIIDTNHRAKISRQDVKDKFELYAQHGVQECWIVNSNDENMPVFVPDELWSYRIKDVYSNEEIVPVNILNGELEIDLQEVFRE